jgi:5-methylcytosine-specific restriction enzyme B
VPNEVLTSDRIADLYQEFVNMNPWPQWEQGYHAEVAAFQAFDPDTFRARAVQERLWRARPVTGIGPGESVDTRGAYADPEIVGQLVELRTHRWPDDPHARARAIQDAYDRVLNLVVPRHSKHRPQAKLGRAFAVLLPEHTHTALNYESHRHVVQLLLGTSRVSLIEGAVLARARLRAALGPEPDLAEQIRRSTYCWWLHLQFDHLVREEPVSTEKGTAPTDEPTPEPIAPWPFTKQSVGLAAVAGYADAYRAVVGAARGGASPDDIAAVLGTQPPSRSPGSCRSLFNKVRLLGFLEHRDGLYQPSEDGERLVEEDPPDILVEKFLVQTFGLGHVLQLIHERGGHTRKEINRHLRDLYPRWTTNFAPGSIVIWAENLGLTERQADGRRVLTEYGQLWADRLPRELPTPHLGEPESDIDSDDESIDPSDNPTRQWPSFGELTAKFRADLRGMVFSDRQLRALHLAWHCHPRKRFAVLSGLSGTGKTALLVHYAQAYCKLAEVDPKQHVEVVPVSPDWRDPSGLFGYFNALHADPTFQAEPALRLVIAAARDPGRPYFLVLDEMNLARVEQYFAPMLSAMEVPGGRLVLHAHEDEINGVPPSVPWPTNLFVGGTVNMDETTHPFSDKVLDRAFTLEFWDVDLETFLARRPGSGVHADAEALLVKMNVALRRVRRHFGYRTTEEILAYLDHAAAAGMLTDDARADIVDDAVFAKVLPRLRGEDMPELQEVLTAVEAQLKRAGLARSAAKLDQMRSRLHETGLTRFWA